MIGKLTISLALENGELTGWRWKIDVGNISITSKNRVPTPKASARNAKLWAKRLGIEVKE